MLVPLPPTIKPVLEAYLPNHRPNRVWLTLSYAQSLDSRIAAQPGTRTVISHPETKTMTHYIRSRHDAILVGAGTVVADDPKLNCRFNEDNSHHTLRPVVLDPGARWEYMESALRAIADRKEGLAPYIVVLEDTQVKHEQLLRAQGGEIIRVPNSSWPVVIDALRARGIRSVMVEGGAKVINGLLEHGDLIDSLIVTVGPVYLGNQGVEVSPAKHVTLSEVKWWTGTQDSVMCARVTRDLISE